MRTPNGRELECEMSANPFNRSGWRYMTKVPRGEKVVGMVLHKGIVLLATDQGLYRLAERRKGKFKLVPIEFQEPTC